MPQFLETKLKAEYPHNPGAVFGTMNKLKLMSGSKETELGRQMQRKHDAKKPTTIGAMMQAGK